jgi:hypothetical protein
MLFVAVNVLVGDAMARAQASPTTTPNRPVVLFSAGYAAPSRWTGGLGLLIPFAKPRPDGDLGDLREHRGLEVEASAGVGGVRLALGPASFGKSPKGPVLFGGNLLGSVTRTRRSPRGASADSTYVGLEGGLVLLTVRVSAGIAQRVAGAEGPRATIFTWSVGVQTGW